MDSNNDRIGDWIKSSGEGKAICKWCCGKEFIIKSGITTIKSHSNSEGHKKVALVRRSNKTITSSFAKTVQLTAQGPSISQAKKAEIICVVRTVTKNLSFESQKDIVDDLKVMCPDSKVPSEMRLHEDKLKYLLTDAIFPYVRDAVVEEIKQAPNYTIFLDEANKFRSYLGVVVRYMPENSWDIKTVCIDLPSVTSGDATTIAKAISGGLSKLGVDPRKCLSIMTDNCNVMRGKFANNI
jgi:hypothetical protein